MHKHNNTTAMFPPPGYYMTDLMAFSINKIVNERASPMSRVESKQIREEHAEDFAEWTVDNYTWEQFYGEVNHINTTSANGLLSLLMKRNDSAAKSIKSVIGIRPKIAKEQTKRMAVEDRIVAWIRMANRLDWWRIKLMNRQTPDPKYYPIPPLEFNSPSAYPHVRKHIDDVIDIFTYKSDMPRIVSAIANYILYALGYRSTKPQEVSDEMWGTLVSKLDLDLLAACPAPYLDKYLTEAHVGRAGGYFPTPSAVSELLLRMTMISTDVPQDDNPASVKARIVIADQRTSDPCMGTGSMLLPATNIYWDIGPNYEISPIVHLVGRAQLAFYAPWTAIQCFLLHNPGGSLGDLAEIQKTVQVQRKEMFNEIVESQNAFNKWMQDFAIATMAGTGKAA